MPRVARLRLVAVTVRDVGFDERPAGERGLPSAEGRCLDAAGAGFAAVTWGRAVATRAGGEATAYETQPGVYFPFFLTFFVVYWLWAFINFGRSLHSSDGVRQQQVMIIMIGTALSLLISGYFDIFKPLTVATQLGYVGSLCSSIWFGFTAYILLKK